MTCTTPPNLQHSRWTVRSTPVYWSTITYWCAVGHRLTTGQRYSNITCQPDDTWSEPEPCEGLFLAKVWQVSCDSEECRMCRTQTHRVTYISITRGLISK